MTLKEHIEDIKQPVKTMSTRYKKRILDRIAEKLNENFEVELVDKM